MTEPSDPDFVPSDSDEDRPKPKYNTREWLQSIETGLRCGLSYYQIANMINSVLVDMDYEEKADFVSVQKIRQMALKHFKNLAEEHEKIQGYEVIGVDGTKSDVKLANNQISHVTDKVTVTCQERHIYVDHFLPPNGQGITLAYCIYEVWFVS